ncbi:MAG: prolyl-tRNA synthetase associated domain-containing protein [Oscillospiraceae bacterium]|jgi:Ala-tRNA(Pro) deacylase
MELCIGRPANCADRIPQEVRCYDFLDALGVEYLRVDHPAADTMAVCQERAAALKTRICKNLFLCNRQVTTFYLLVMPADKPFKTSVVSPQLGVARLHFADEKYMIEFLDLCPGSVSILGLMNDRDKRVRLLMDRDLKEQEWFACHPCINTSSLKFKTAELFEKVIPAMGHEPTFLEL